MAIDFKKYKNFPKVSTSIIVLSFLMPFFLVKCGGTTLASVSGVDMIVGMDVKGATESAKGGRIDASIFGIIAALCAIVGVVLAWAGSQKMKMISMVVAIVGLACLVVMYLQLKLEATKEDTRGMITIGLGFGFYLAFLGWLLNAVFFGLWMKEDKKTVTQASQDTVDDVI